MRIKDALLFFDENPIFFPSLSRGKIESKTLQTKSGHTHTHTRRHTNPKEERARERYNGFSLSLFSSLLKKKVIMSSLLFKRTMGAAFAKVSGLTPFPRLKPPAKSQTRVGVVSSSKMEKTVSVVVERLVKHPRWKKYVRKRKKYKMHHEANYKGNEANWLLPGDVVKMVHTRPKSKTKFWELYASAGGLIKKARVFDAEAVNEKVRERKLEERAARRKMERGFAASGGVEE